MKKAYINTLPESKVYARHEEDVASCIELGAYYAVTLFLSHHKIYVNTSSTTLFVHFFHSFPKDLIERKIF